MAEADVRCYFDPVCPFAWMTSKWVRMVAAQRDCTVDWRFISLRLINSAIDHHSHFRVGYEEGHTSGLRLLRVAARAWVELAPDPADRRLAQAAAPGHRRVTSAWRPPGSCTWVAVTTSSTWSSKIDGGWPGRGSSASPSGRFLVNPPRHRATMCSPTRNSAATALSCWRLRTRRPGIPGWPLSWGSRLRRCGSGACGSRPARSPPAAPAPIGTSWLGMRGGRRRPKVKSLISGANFRRITLGRRCQRGREPALAGGDARRRRRHRPVGTEREHPPKLGPDRREDHCADEIRDCPWAVRAREADR